MTVLKRPDIEEEAERILAMSDEEILADAIAEYGNEKGTKAAAEIVRLQLLMAVKDHKIKELEAKVKGMESILMLKAASAPSWDALSPREHDALDRLVADLKAPLERINAALLPAAKYAVDILEKKWPYVKDWYAPAREAVKDAELSWTEGGRWKGTRGQLHEAVEAEEGGGKG